MDRRPAHAGHTTPGPPDGLATLLETERALDERLARADADAATLIDEARQRARDEAARVDETLAAELGVLDERETRAIEAAVAETARDAERVVARLDGLADDEVDALARFVLDDFLGERA